MASKTIATHNGKFHADEVFAVCMLRMLEPFRDARVVRSRDPAVLAAADVVVDVGGVYDPASNRFDHHQPEFKDSFSADFKTLLSSAGLVYKHFGRELLGKAASELGLPPLEDSLVEGLHAHVYRAFIEAFDAHDNGISAYPSDLKPAFNRPFDIFWQIDLMNTRWNQEGAADLEGLQMKGFERAVECMRQSFEAYLENVLLAWLPARQIVHQAVFSEKNASSLDGVLVLPIACPWKDHLFSLEAGIVDRLFYLVYPESSNGTWRIQAVPINADSFVSRLALPESWRGARDAELDGLLQTDAKKFEVELEASGAIFVHRSGFIGGHRTREGALQMARLSLFMQKRS